MPVLAGNPPAIRTPGIGPNGPGPIDSRRAIADVGTGSVPYGPTNGYATPNGVTGFVGPAAGSLQQPSSWYVRASGSNNNGGSSASLTADRTGTDGVTNNTTTFGSPTGAFTSADVGKGICIGTGSAAERYKIISVSNSTTVILNRATQNGASGKTWALGGAWADLRPVVGDVAVTAASAGSGVQAGDTVYVGAGTYRAVTTIPSTPTIPFAFNGQVNVVGDVTGQYTGDPGMVQFTAYTTNDKTAPSATTLLNLNGKSNLAFSNIMFVGGTNNVIQATVPASQNVTFTDCAFLSQGSPSFILQNSPGAQFNWLFDRCYFFANSGASTINLWTAAGGGDYDANVTIRNSSVLNLAASPWVTVTNVGTSTFKGGGVRFRNITSYGRQSFLTTTASQNSIIFPCSVTDSYLVYPVGPVLSAGTSGQIVESYNLIVSGTPRTNVSAGAGSISDGSYAQLSHFGQERIWGQLLRRFGEPMSGSPLLGFGSDGAQTLYDLANNPRPAGGLSALPAVGALERANTAAQATSPAPPQGTNTWQFTGPGYQDFLVPVNNTATTVSISVQRDSAYSAPPGRGNPAMLILGNATLGVTAQTIPDTGATGGWNTLTGQAFTPTGTGWVTVRIASYDGTGASVVSFADFTIT